MEWRNWKYIITVILNEDWTYKDKSEIIDEMLMESIMKRIVFIGEGRIKSGPAINSSNSFILLFLMGRMIELMNCLRRRPAQENEWARRKRNKFICFFWVERFHFSRQQRRESWVCFLLLFFWWVMGRAPPNGSAEKRERRKKANSARLFLSFISIQSQQSKELLSWIERWIEREGRARINQQRNQWKEGASCRIEWFLWWVMAAGPLAAHPPINQLIIHSLIYLGCSLSLSSSINQPKKWVGWLKGWKKRDCLASFTRSFTFSSFSRGPTQRERKRESES